MDELPPFFALSAALKTVTRHSNLDETQNSLQYAQRVRTIKNDVSKNETNKEMLKMKKMMDYWKAQAGIPEDLRDYVDLQEITDERPAQRTSSASGFLAVTQPSRTGSSVDGGSALPPTEGDA